MINENLNSGSTEPYYTVEKEENAVVYTYNNPQNFYDKSINYNNRKSRKSSNKNEDVINYVLEHIDERYDDFYKKVE